MALYMLFTRISHLKKTNFLTSLPRGGYEKNWDLRRGGLPLRGGYPFVGVGMDPSRSYVYNFSLLIYKRVSCFQFQKRIYTDWSYDNKKPYYQLLQTNSSYLSMMLERGV